MHYNEKTKKNREQGWERTWFPIISYLVDIWFWIKQNGFGDCYIELEGAWALIYDWPFGYLMVLK